MKNQLYLLVFGATLCLEDVKKFVDQQDCITDWFCSMPNSIFLVTSSSANAVYQLVREKFSEGRLFITEVSPRNRQGWLPRSHWEKINNINNMK